MWADTLLGAERGHAQLLLVWGGASVLAATVLCLTVGRPRRSPLIFHFAVQFLAWGAVECALALAALRAPALRDLSAATQLDRLLWLNLGLDIGYVAVGAAIGVCAWILGRRHGGVGAGAAIAAQGLALLVLDARFILLIERST